MTGGYGRDEVRQFCATWFIGHWPADVQITKRADPSRYTEPENALEAPLSRPRRSSRSSLARSRARNLGHSCPAPRAKEARPDHEKEARAFHNSQANLALVS
jgi:hypothetical protein